MYFQMRLCLPNLSKLIMRQDKGPFCQKNLKTKKNLFHPILKIGQGKGPFHQNNLKTQSFPQRQKIQNFLVVRISRTKTFQTERVNCFRNKNALRVRKSLLQTCHFYHEFVNFQIVRYLPNLSTFIAIGLSSNHLWIFKLWVLRQIFSHSSHFQVFKWGVVRQFFPHSSQLICHPIICEFSKCALVAKSLQIHRNQSFSNYALFAKFFLNCRN